MEIKGQEGKEISHKSHGQLGGGVRASYLLSLSEPSFSSWVFHNDSYKAFASLENQPVEMMFSETRSFSMIHASHHHPLSTIHSC